ncbi:flagellar hook-length control protein FliK [Acidovorax sp. Root70]|uniref:flagellar hook-length control protein FliK n=1 Tax=Acidovorax sp. Root70 TaxID=1736590 RepID=UPI000A56C633|nr:flagellar hook-length control protein FliK [Acidovorax sp. Root70]
MEPTKVASSQGTQPAHAARAKSPSQSAADAGDPTAAGGFLALLAALGDGADGEISGDTVISSAENGADPASLAAADASAMAAWQGLLAPMQSLNEPGGANGQTGLGTSQLASSGLGGITAVAQPGSQGNALNDLLLGGIPQGLVAETAKLDASADLREEPSQGALAALGRTFSRLQSASAQRAGGAGMADAALGSATVRDSAAHSSAIHGGSVALASSAGERAFSGLPVGSVVERSGVAHSSPTGAEGGTPIPDGLLAAAASARATEASAGGRSHEDGAGGGAWSEGASGASPVESGNFTDATTLTDPAALGTEEQVAEQVAYWVNQKTQNAELTLQRDGQPVEVSVSLSGNEAHVSFRSDQPQTRELLDQSMAQLSDLLRSEGLVLSGMSVGTSARDSGGGRETDQQRPREGVRQAQVVSAVPGGTASLARSGGAADRAVDVFV